jgi:hypothetical protein
LVLERQGPDGEPVDVRHPCFDIAAGAGDVRRAPAAEPNALRRAGEEHVAARPAVERECQRPVPVERRREANLTVDVVEGKRRRTRIGSARAARQPGSAEHSSAGERQHTSTAQRLRQRAILGGSSSAVAGASEQNPLMKCAAVKVPVLWRSSSA